MEESSSNKACTFIKRKRGNIRKKQSDYSVVDDESENVVIKKSKKGKENPTVTSTKSNQTLNNSDQSKNELDIYKSDLSMIPHGASDMGATVSVIPERADPEILAGDDAEKAEKVYRGLNNDTENKGVRPSAKGSAIRAGPIRSMNIRETVRFDYQPDVCKDYKETGYCGFGDSCKFMHDRGDYKSGWELEKEWEEQQRKKMLGIKEEEEDYEIKDEEENFPFACAICRSFFVEPVVTKCKHFFCEKCALDNFKKSMKCFICATNTYGSFASVDKKTREKLNRRMQEALENGEHLSNEDDEDQAPQEGETKIIIDGNKIKKIEVTGREGDENEEQND